MSVNKDAIAIVLDTGPSVSKEFLKQACHCISLVLQRKIFSESKDEVALVLFGTEETDNPLSGNGEYQNITVKRELAPVNWDFMTIFQEEIERSQQSGDFIDALVVAMDHLRGETGGRKISGEQIYLFSNFEGAVSTDKLDIILKAVTNSSTQISVIGPDLDEDSEDEVSYNNNNETNRLQKSATFYVSGEAIIKDILKKTNGSSFTFEEAVPILSFFKKRNVRPTPWKVNLELGSSLKLPVCCYLKIKKYTPKSWKKIYLHDKNSKLLIERSYHKNDEAQTEVEKAETVEAYRYGSTLVPFSAEDKFTMAYKSGGKSFKILAFTKQEHIKRYHYLGDSVHYVVADKTDLTVSTALSAFIHALYETQMVAIVRHVYSERSNPKIGFLAPHIKTDYECLTFTTLPFMEDIRTYTFGSLNLNSKNVPNAEQLAAIDELITTMNLAPEDKEGKINEMLKPKSICNPYIQRLYQCMLHRGLKPDAPLPPPSRDVMKLFEPNEQMMAECQSISDKIKSLFPLKRVIKKQEKKTGAETFKDEPSLKKSKLSNESSTDTPLGNDMTVFSRGAITEVGTVSPIENFLTIIKNNPKDIEVAGKQMQKVIFQLVMDSFGKLVCQENYQKAVGCIKILRTEMGTKFPIEFNEFMKELKESVFLKGKLEFWEHLKNENLGLVTQNEASKSDVLEEEAKLFFTTVVNKLPSAPPSPQDDADDLLDEL